MSGRFDANHEEPIDLTGLRERMQELREEVSARTGETFASLTATAGRWEMDRIIPTGSVGLDMATGVGGWPRGRIIEIFGQYSSGKTTVALWAVAEAQKLGLGCLYIDAEMALDPNYMKKLGVDLDSLLIYQPSGLENAIDVMNNCMDTGNFGLIVVDSIPALKSTVVMEGDASQETRALEPRRWSAQMAKLVKNASDNQCSIILLNQIRDGMGTMPWDPKFTTPGGHAIKFGASLRVQFRHKITNDEPQVHKITGKMLKNKVSAPYKEGEVSFTPGQPVDQMLDIITSAYGLVISFNYKFEELSDGSIDQVKKNNWYSISIPNGYDMAVHDNENFDEELNGNNAFIYTNPETGVEHLVMQKYQEKNFIEFITQYPTIIRWIHNRILDTLNDTITQDEDEFDDAAEGNPEDSNAPEYAESSSGFEDE